MAQRAAAHAHLSLGLISIPVDLVSTVEAAKKSATQFNMLCPDCNEPTKPEQFYMCENKHGVNGLVTTGATPYKAGDLTRRGKIVDGRMIEIPADEAKAVKESDDDGDAIFTLSRCPAEQVENATLPADLSYRVRPPKIGGTGDKYRQVYSLFYELASDPTQAIIGEITLRKQARLARLITHRGQLVLQLLVRPDDLAPAEHIDLVDLSDKERAMAQALVESVTSDFDTDQYRNLARERAEALIAAKAADPNAVFAPAPGKTTATTVDDLTALLEASLANAKGAA